MIYRHTHAGPIAALVCACLAAAAPGAAKPMLLDAAFAQLPKYDYGQSRECLNAIDAHVVASHGDPARRKAIEERLAAVLAGEATRAAKEFACRKLGTIGSTACVPAVAKLLADPQLAHMARFTLERVPDPHAAAAMCDAMQQASPDVAVGIVNSLGVRRDPQAVRVLTPLLDSPNPKLASAAAGALGAIGTRACADALVRFRDRAPDGLRVCASHACLDAAAALLGAGHNAPAAGIYKRLYTPQEPDAIRLAAFRGLVLAQPAQSEALLADALAGSDHRLRGEAVRLLGSTVGPETARAVAGRLAKLPPEGQVALLQALQERGDSAVRPAVLQATNSPDSAVRAAAFAALVTVGSPGDVPMLAERAAGKGGDSSSARKTLARLVGKDVDRAIVAAMEGARRPVRIELIRSLGSRYSTASLAVLLPSFSDADEAVRRAAVEAVGMMADEKQAAPLVAAVKAAKSDGERRTAEKALAATCTRAGEKCADAVIAGLDVADVTLQCVLIRALGKARGAASLEAIRKAIRDEGGEVQTTAIRVLGEWPDERAMPDLLAIATRSEGLQHHVLALRGYVRLAGSSRQKPEQKLAALASALELARRPEEKKEALAEVGKVHTFPALELAAARMADEALREEAASAVISIAERLRVKGQEPRQAVVAAVRKALKATRGDGPRKAAQKVLDKYGK